MRLITTIGGVAILLASGAALACRCADVSLAEHYQLADSVQFVEVIGLRETYTPRNGIQILVKPVGRPYKGRPQVISNFFTGPDKASCGIRPAPGQRWAFFAQHDPDYPGVGHVNICNGTRRLPADASALRSALTALRTGKEPESLPDAQDGPAPAPEEGRPQQFSVIGLLEMPRLLEPHRFRGEERAAFRPVPVYSAPAVGAQLVAELVPDDEIPTAEFSYERPGAIVHETRPGWYRIALHPEAGAPSGWVQGSAANAYWPIEKILPDALSYLTEYWSGLVWPEPAGGTPQRFPARFRDPDNEQPVEVIGVRHVDNSLWWQVEVYTESVCTGRGRPKIAARGWVPAFDGQGRNTAWFHSRGC